MKLEISFDGHLSAVLTASDGGAVTALEWEGDHPKILTEDLPQIEEGLLVEDWLAVLRYNARRSGRYGEMSVSYIGKLPPGDNVGQPVNA